MISSLVDDGSSDIVIIQKAISKNVSRSLTTIYSLQTSLDFDKGGEIAGNLAELYGYCIRKLLASNSGGNVDGVAETRRLIIPLAEAWNLIK